MGVNIVNLLYNKYRFVCKKFLKLRDWIMSLFSRVAQDLESLCLEIYFLLLGFRFSFKYQCIFFLEMK